MSVPAAHAQVTVKIFQIPAQSLASALLEFSRQADVMVVAAPEMTKGKHSSPVIGALPPGQAISRLLLGSGLEAVSNPRGGFIVRTAQSDRTERAYAPARSTPPGVSEPAPAESSSAMATNEIVVTARRVDERLQDVPISIAAFGRDELTRRQINNVADLPQIAAGVKIEAQNGKPSTLQLTLRGQRMYGVLSAQDSPTAFYFADAAMMPVQGLNGALYDLESIQVLKGPQGTLFGRNTTGGAVLINPAKPKDELSGYLRGRVGNFDTYGVEGVINVPASDTFLLRASVRYDMHGPYQKLLAPIPPGRDPWEASSLDGRISAIWRPSQTIENYLVAYGSSARSGAITPKLVAVRPLSPAAAFDGTGTKAAYPNIMTEVWDGVSDPLTVRTNMLGYDDVDLIGGVNTLTVTLDNLKLKSITSYRQVDAKSRVNYSGTIAPILGFTTEVNQEVFSQELQLAGSLWDDKIKFVTGLYYSSHTGSDRGSSAVLFAPPSPIFTATFADVDNTSYAAYLSADANLTDRLTLSAGIRYTVDKRAIDWHSTFANDFGPENYISPIYSFPFTPGCAVRDDAGAILPLSACSFKSSVTYRVPTWNVGLNYKFSNDAMVYFTHRRGYRSGGFNERALTAAQRIPFGPETVMDYEVGLKTGFNFSDWSFKLNLAAYHDEYKDLQRNALNFIPVFGPTSSIFNAARGKVDGIEVDMSIAPTRRLRFDLAYAYTKPKYTSFDFVVGGITRDFSDRGFSGIPKDTLNTSMTYTLPVDQSLGTMEFGAAYTYVGETIISDTYQSKAQLAVALTPAQFAAVPDSKTPFVMPAYGVFDASYRWSDIAGSPFSLSLYMKNVFDKRYAVANNPIYEGTGIMSLFFGAPRTFGLQVNYQFKQ